MIGGFLQMIRVGLSPRIRIQKYMGAILDI